jgi:DNA-binding MurR/RpiR family transcriptional regulator
MAATNMKYNQQQIYFLVKEKVDDVHLNEIINFISEKKKILIYGVRKNLAILSKIWCYCPCTRTFMQWDIVN